MLGGVCAVGSAALLARWGLDAGISALQLALWRLTLASVLLIAWDLRVGRSRPSFRPRTRALMGAAGVCLALHFVTWFASLRLIPVARSTLLVTTSPVWAGLLGMFLPTLRPARGFWIGVLIAALGVILVTAQGAAGMQGWSGKAPGSGDALAIVAAILVVPYLLIVQQIQAEFGTLRTVTWVYACAAVCVWLLALAQGRIVVPHSPAIWGSALGMALVPQLIGHTALNRSLKHFTAGQVTAATLLEPIFAAALAWLLLGESITFGQATGAALLLGGVALTLRVPIEFKRA